MKTTFVYSSLSGNTKRLAYALHELSKPTSEIFNIEDYEEVESDVYVLCSWIDRGRPDKKSLAKVELFYGKIVYLIATLGADPESTHGKECVKNMKEIYSGCNILGIDLVQGSISDRVIETFKDLPKDHPHVLTEAKLKRYEQIKERPNREDFHATFVKLKNHLEMLKL